MNEYCRSASIFESVLIASENSHNIVNVSYILRAYNDLTEQFKGCLLISEVIRNPILFFIKCLHSLTKFAR